MNKQEAIEKIKSTLIHENTRHLGKVVNVYGVIDIIKQIDEPEKPIVSQFVADWYEVNKDDFENNLFMYSRSWKRQDKSSFARWFSFNDNEPIQTLVNMHQFGYEVEKEKLYTVEIPNPNGGTCLALCKDVDGKLFFDAFFSEEWKTFGKCKLTESKIKQDFDWAWQFAEEVKE